MITCTRPCSDKSLEFQHFKHAFIFAIFSSQLSNSVCFLSYPKCTPNALIVFFCQLMPAKLSFLFVPLPSQSPSVFSLSSFKPETSPKSSMIFKPCFIASSLSKNKVVSSASLDIWITILLQFISIFKPHCVFYLILTASISTTSRNKRALNGHPCLIPFF